MNQRITVCGKVSLALAAALLALPSKSQPGSVLIDQVRITLSIDHQPQQVAGTLYRVNASNSERQWAADVLSNGKLSQAARCNSLEYFEAEVGRALAYPDDPARVRCKKQLSFSFTRPLIAKASNTKGTFLEAPIDRIDVTGLFELEMLARGAGDADLARATTEAMTGSAAIWLGDLKLGRYVKRDSVRGYKLVFNDEGVTALKAKQIALKLDPTGEVDAETRKAITRTIFVRPYKNTGITYCVAR